MPRLSANLRQLHARGVFVFPSGEDAQQVIVKAYRGLPKTTATHLRYLVKRKGLAGTDAGLFSTNGSVIDARQFIQAALSDQHQFRFVISPKNTLPDPQAFTLEFMQRVDGHVGPLDWIGVVHHDTAYIHSHVIVRGTDLDGRPLYLTRRYICRDLQNLAQNVATGILGHVIKGIGG